MKSEHHSLKIKKAALWRMVENEGSIYDKQWHGQAFTVVRSQITIHPIFRPIPPNSFEPDTFY